MQIQNPVHNRCVRRLYFHDGTKTLQAIFGALVAAILCLPISLRLARALVEITAGKQTNRVLSVVSDFFQKATLPDVFRLNFILFLIVTCLFLFARLRKSLGLISVHKRPWSLFIHANDYVHMRRDPLRKNPIAFRHAIAGFLLSCVLVILVAWYFYRGSLFDGQTAGSLVPILWKICGALFAALMIEIVLRGVLLGIWLRHASPLVAIIFVALIGSLHCFLQSPANWIDPQEVNLTTGFSIVKAMFLHGLSEKEPWTNFIPIFSMGMVLGLARYRSSSLWLSCGLHLGVSMCGVLWSFHASKVSMPLPVHAGMSAVLASVMAVLIVLVITRKNVTV